MSEHIVAKEDELEPGDRIVVEIKGREIGIFNIEGEYYAYLNWCPHQAGPICEGVIDGTWEASFDKSTLETNVEWDSNKKTLSCCWHGWEFDLTNGERLSRQNSSEEVTSLPSYPTKVEDENIIVSL